MKPQNIFDFEKPIVELENKRTEMLKFAADNKVEMDTTVEELEKHIQSLKENVYGNLTRWQRVQISRHPERPYALDYIQHISEEFIELFGDRNFKDDKAMIGGLGRINGQSVMFIGQQKGRTTKDRQYRNFGMPNPEGYRKALRLMKLAEKFGIPVVCLIDTPGAYPGLEAEERGQGEAIARNLLEMSVLRVPIICIVIGEGASGGALGIGVGDRVYMMENTWYSVISPESCSSILWRSWENKELAAEALKLTAEDNLEFKIIDGIISEPLGGAHRDPNFVFEKVKEVILRDLQELPTSSIDQMIENRIERFSQIGEHQFISPPTEGHAEAPTTLPEEAVAALGKE